MEIASPKVPGRELACRFLPLIALGYLLGGAPMLMASSERFDGVPEDRPELFSMLAGNEYQREEFDADGQLVGHQKIRVGTCTVREGKCVLPIELITSGGDDSGGADASSRAVAQAAGAMDAEKKVRIEIISDPGEQEEDLTLVAFLGQADRELELRIVERGPFYPRTLRTGEKIPDLRLELHMTHGFLSFLGAHSAIRVWDRRVEKQEEGRLRLVSRVLVRFKALGITWKASHYRSHQLVDPDRGLIREELVERKGGRQVFQLLRSGIEVDAPEGRPER
jgi:hypothetical protein